MSPWRVFTLVLSCLCFIPCVVVLMNMQTPAQGGDGYSSSIEPVLLSQPVRSAAVEARPPEISASNAMASSQTGLSISRPPATGVGEADYLSLKKKNLLIPVPGIRVGDLRDTFDAARSEGRIHQAIDIMAPSGTPVVAVVDGKAARLHTSDRGGLMLYETDESSLYVYYYAHLLGYAEGMYEGKPLKRGEIIAYVGDTGNAGPGNYHLHFGISKLSAPGKWHGGEPINPYSLLTAD
jgi:murein DD-endopeptidase MepM/ murein hydrolase activator NlpD